MSYPETLSWLPRLWSNISSLFLSHLPPRSLTRPGRSLQHCNSLHPPSGHCLLDSQLTFSNSGSNNPFTSWGLHSTDPPPYYCPSWQSLPSSTSQSVSQLQWGGDPQCCLNSCYPHSTPEHGKMTGVGSRKLAEQCLWSERRTVRRVWAGGWEEGGGEERQCGLHRKGLRTVSSGCFSVNGSEATEWAWGKERGVQGLRGETSRVRGWTDAACLWGHSPSCTKLTSQVCPHLALHPA